MATQLTAKNFKSKLSTYINTETNRRDQMQNFISFAVLHYGGKTDNDKQTTGDTSLLTALMRSCIGVKSLPTVTIKDYIKAHANVHWVKSSGGNEYVFKKISKGVDVNIVECLTPWYEWEGGEHNKVKADADVIAWAKAVLTRISTAEKEGRHFKDADAAEKIKTALASALPAV